MYILLKSYYSYEIFLVYCFCADDTTLVWPCFSFVKGMRGELLRENNFHLFNHVQCSSTDMYVGCLLILKILLGVQPHYCGFLYIFVAIWNVFNKKDNQRVIANLLVYSTQAM